MIRVNKDIIINEKETQKSIAYLERVTRRKINIAIRFHHSLQALLSDVDSAQKESPSETIFAVDTSEIVGFLNYNQNHLSTFAFGGLLLPNNKHQHYRRFSSELEVLDRLILSQLFEGRKKPFIIMDAHADEISDIRNALCKITRTDLGMINEFEMNAFDGFSISQLEGIKSFILDGTTETDKNDEFEIFIKKFLPHWRRDLFQNVINKSSIIYGIESFIRNGNYVYLRSLQYAKRALSRCIDDFDWPAFESYAYTPEIVKEWQDISRTIALLCSKIHRAGRKQKFINRAAKRDGEAMADIHILNTYIQNTGGKYRVELISRTPTLHDVMAALPHGRLQVTLRHPLLIPDIYDFSSSALASIGDVAQRVDSLLQPYLAANSTEDKNREIDDLREAASSAAELVPLLRDVLSIQQGLEAGSDNIRTVYKDTLRKNVKNEPDVSKEVEAVFELLVDRLAQREDPFTNIAFHKLIERSAATAKLEWERCFHNNRNLRCRVLVIDDRRLCPRKFVAVRLVEGRLTRIFHIHSKTWIKRIEDLTPIINENKTGPTEINIPTQQIIEGLYEALKRLTDRKIDYDKSSDGLDHERFGIDAALLAAMALASSGKVSTAITLSSTILHDLTARIRKGYKALEHRTIGQLLAFRELLLFRHYCERQLAVETFFEPERATFFIRGSVEHSLAQAQRDIDFAGFVSESIERKEIEREKANEKVTPAGYSKLQDFRLRLAHMSTWMDMLLMSEVSGEDYLWHADRFEPAIYGIHQRKDIWAGGGLAKEALYYAHTARAAAEASDHEPIRRYYYNLEARLLQNYLVMLLLFLIGEWVPGMFVFLDPNRKIPRDKVLVFSDWSSAWERYDTIKVKQKFEMRLHETIKLVFTFLQELDSIRQQKLNAAEKTELGKKLRVNTAQKIRNHVSAISEVVPATFGTQLALRLCSRLEKFGQ